MLISEATRPKFRHVPVPVAVHLKLYYILSNYMKCWHILYLQYRHLQQKSVKYKDKLKLQYLQESRTINKIKNSKLHNDQQTQMSVTSKDQGPGQGWRTWTQVERRQKNGGKTMTWGMTIASLTSLLAGCFEITESVLIKIKMVCPIDWNFLVGKKTVLHQKVEQQLKGKDGLQ